MMKGVDHNATDKENTPLLCRMLNAEHPRLTCFARLLGSGYLTQKTLSQSKKWLQRKLKITSEPASFILISNALFCLVSLETPGYVYGTARVVSQTRARTRAYAYGVELKGTAMRPTNVL